MGVASKSLRCLALPAALATCLSIAGLSPAAAEVRFGKNTRIGGHDVSGQTFNRNRRGLYILHDRKPANEGCRWRANRDGSRTKVCNLQRR
jgi:hypothetical protein